jgi:anti-anti-sigma factor
VADAEAAIARARQERPGPLDVDLSALTFLDSSGLQLIMELHRTCKAEECALTIGPGPRSVQRVFDLARVLDILPFR